MSIVMTNHSTTSRVQTLSRLSGGHRPSLSFFYCKICVIFNEEINCVYLVYV